MKNILAYNNFTQQEQQWLVTAQQMCREAGKVLKEHFRRRDLNIEDKGSAFDIVTEADKGSERIIIDTLHARFPDHAILSEESGDDHRQAQCQWVIDPLDGTVNYSAGLATYCISIGLKVDGETRMGYVYAPTLDEEFFAIKGKGSYGPYGQLQAKFTTELQRAVISTGFPYDKATNPDNNVDRVKLVLPRIRGLRRLGSAAMDLCYVAAGWLDGYWELNLKEWDACAGELIALEAGAIVKRYRDNHGICILAACPGIAQQLLGLVE
ncbi:MAG: inositol monophosphatase [Muribaculaceae bacterium]|nr:inositol monophosphatase [Muribaculaceae bacterium]